MASLSPEHDQAAQGADWLQRYGDFLYRFALKRVGDVSTAEDLVQETFLAALRGHFDGRASERTWLIGILKHKIADHLRSRIREKSYLESVEFDRFPDHLFTSQGKWKREYRPVRSQVPSTELEFQEFLSILRKCVALLPARLHAPFTLRYMEEREGPKLWECLGITEENLWVSLHRARLRIWTCLTDHWFLQTENAR